MIITGQLQKKLFPYVIKPGRYAGGEPGQIVKDPVGRVAYVHAFPDKYEIGQSYLGLQTLYHVVNADDRFLCERVFAVDRDAEEIMRRENIPLFSMETKRPVVDFDAIGFTLPYELVYTNVLAMLDLAGIPLHTDQRTDAHPLVLAGGPAVYNPEPMADFIDCFFIGDGEEGIIEILSVLREYRTASRDEKLEQICRKVESVYIPKFYDNNRKPIVSFAPEQIKARVVPELKPDYYPQQPIVPLVETAHDHLSIEIMRGCPRGCRFCQAGPIYRPVRVRPQPEINHQIDTQLQQTGYKGISLLSLSTSDYPGIDKLAMSVARRLEKWKVAVSLPSLRPGTVTPLLLDAVKNVRKGGLTIAPEAGTERLRMFIRKDIPDAAIYDTAELAFQKGWTKLKLYFMVGLPSETKEDIQGIIDIISRVYDISRRYTGKKTINVTLSPFVPEPHTPFQWDAMNPVEVILDKLQFIKRHVRNRNINIKHPSCESAVLQGVLGRGGRELGAVIETVFQNGGRFDGWSEDFDPQKWFATLKQHGLDINQRLGSLPFTADLPWSHINKGPSQEHLQKERHRTSSQLLDYTPYAQRAGEISTPEPKIEYGRGKKKIVSRNTAAPTKNRVRLRWGKTERYRYMSHLDNLRTIERAIRRSRIPVAYSQGFNPTMKLSFGPPLPLGMTSEAEYVDITLETSVLPYMIENVMKAMPEGINIIESGAVLGKSSSLSAKLNRAVYSLQVEDLANIADIEERIDQIMGASSLPIERIGKDQVRTIDIRPAIYEIKIDSDRLFMTLGLSDGGYARPAEVLGLLFSSEEAPVYAYRMHRCEMYRIDERGNKINPMNL